MTPQQQPNASGDSEDATITARIKCAVKTCGTEFETEACVIGERTYYQSRECPACQEKATEIAAAAAAEKQKEERQKRFNKLAGEYYTSAAIRDAMPKDKVREIRALLKMNKGVMAVGLSGAFKTTCMLSGVRWLIEEKGYEVAMLTGAEFGQRLTAAAKACNIESFLRPLKKVPWLFIDDLGHRITETVGEALHDLIEARVKHCRPMLVTTQFGSADFCAQFERPETGLAVARRIRLLCEKVEFSPPNLEHP